MEALIIVLLLALLALVAIGAAGVWLLARQQHPAGDASEAQRLEQQLAAMKAELAQAMAGTQQAVSEAQRTVLQQVNNVDSKLNQRLEAVDNRLGQSLASSSQAVGRIGEQLGELSQAAKRMLDVGRDIASLQDILRAPKLRGGFGELQLERILADCGLPPNSYRLQHRFPSGVQVDAIVIIGGGFVPVDSKFPMENFNRVMATQDPVEREKLRRVFLRDVQKHVDAVGKYILPDEGTFDFALMFIPAEGVYHETFFGQEDIVDETSVWMYALNRRVIPVSPSNFYAYLYALVLGLRGLQVDRQAREIIDHLGRLTGDFSRIREDFGTLGKHLKNASDRYGDVDRSFTKFGDRLALTLNEPVQKSLPEPDQPPARSTLPRPATVTNGSDEP
jgi:DNA recombination protein RmuC